MIASEGVLFVLLLGLGLVGTGAVAGLLAGLLGVGGGIVIVPMLFWLFNILDVAPDVAMHLAVGTSLAVIIPTSLSSARAHRQRGSIDVDLLKRWAPFIVLGALAGGLASGLVSSLFLTGLFGVVALVVAVHLALPNPPVLADEFPVNPLTSAGIPSGIGVFSALMGIGGGTLTVPVLTLFSYPVHKAVGTAAAIGILIAVPAAAGFIWSGLGIAGRPEWSLGFVSLPAAVLLFSTSVLTAPLGSKLAHALDPAPLKRLFALFLFVTSLRMLWSVIT